MSRKDGRNESRELLVLLALVAPAAGLFIWGTRSCAAAHHFGMPGVLGIFSGLVLTVAAGCYHYRTDYKGGPYRHPIVSFLGLAVFSSLVAYLVNHVLFR
jgi:hypothetical protein